MTVLEYMKLADTTDQPKLVFRQIIEAIHESDESSQSLLLEAALVLAVRSGPEETDELVKLYVEWSVASYPNLTREQALGLKLMRVAMTMVGLRLFERLPEVCKSVQEINIEDPYFIRQKEFLLAICEFKYGSPEKARNELQFKPSGSVLEEYWLEINNN